jgi:hypothetical protein
MKPQAVDIAKERLQEFHSRLVVRVGNWEDEVVLYVRYQAGSMKVYRSLPDEIEGFRIIKDGLEPKVKT